MVEPVETTADEPAPATKVAIPTDNDYTFETTDGLLAEMEKGVSTGSTTEGTRSISERTFSTTADTSLSNAEEKTPAPETENTVLSDNDYSFKTNDSLLAEKNKTLPVTTRNIIIISSVTITAAMAAGIIINRKKRKQRRGI